MMLSWAPQRARGGQYICVHEHYGFIFTINKNSVKIAQNLATLLRTLYRRLYDISFSGISRPSAFSKVFTTAFVRRPNLS